MILRMNFKGPCVGLFDRIMAEKTIFVIKSKHFYVERPFFSKKRRFFAARLREIFKLELLRSQKISSTKKDS